MFRPRLDADSMKLVDWAASYMGVDRKAAHSALLHIGARALRSAGDHSRSTRDQRGPHGTAPVHTGPAQTQAAHGPGPQRTGTECAHPLIVHTQSTVRSPVDHLAADVLRVFEDGHSQACCLSEWDEQSGRSIASVARRTGRMSDRQQTSLEGVLVKANACRGPKRDAAAGYAERAEKTREAMRRTLRKDGED